jgi:hypothetical protein
MTSATDYAGEGLAHLFYGYGLNVRLVVRSSYRNGAAAGGSEFDDHSYARI